MSRAFWPAAFPSDQPRVEDNRGGAGWQLRPQVTSCRHAPVLQPRGRLSDGGQPYQGQCQPFFLRRKLGQPCYRFRTAGSLPSSESNSAVSNSGLGHLRTNSPPGPAYPHYQVERWTTEQGLPANKVRSLCRTQDGYLWVGTVEGLARFDGVRFTVFNETNTPAMQMNGSIALCQLEDDQSRLWVGTKRGLLCYGAGRFLSFEGQQHLMGLAIHCLAARFRGGFWIGADTRLGFWDGSQVRWIAPLSERLSSPIMALEEMPNGILWIGTRNGLFRWDSNNDQLEPVEIDSWRNLDFGYCLDLLADRRHRLWIGTAGGVCRLDPDASKPGLMPAPYLDLYGGGFPDFARFAEDPQGTVWATAATLETLAAYFPEPGGEPNTPHLLPKIISAMECLLFDPEGLIWIGSREGLFRLRQEPFSTLSLTGRGRTQVNTLTEAADGSLWLGGSSPVLVHWTRNNLTTLDTQNLEAGEPMNVTCVDQAGRVWVASKSGGIYRFPASLSETRSASPLVRQFPELEPAQFLLAARNGGFWIGTARGLYRVSASLELQRLEEAGTIDVRVLSEDHASNLWIGTADDGLVRLGPDGQRAHIQQLPNDQVWSLHESSDGSMWIGTEGGLCRVRAGQVNSCGPKSGLPQMRIGGIAEDDYGRLWLNHAAGATRVDRAEVERWFVDRSQVPAVANFGPREGLTIPNIGLPGRPQGILKGKDGRLWFGKQQGMAMVNPSQCPSNAPPPQVWIETVRADDQLVPLQLPLKLSARHNHRLEIGFTATSLHSPEKVRIEYRLDGEDKDWRLAGNLRRATYMNLAPGRYQFRVRARNREGQWSRRETGLSFSISPVFWRTWPFYLVCGLAVSGTAAGWVVHRLRQQRRRHELEARDQLEKERLRIARDMHDHLGAHLAGLALSSTDDPAAQARQTLHEVNDLIWSVHPENDTVDALADFVANFAGRYLGGAGIALELDLPDHIPPRLISGALRHELVAMFKEVLRNVIQHAHATQVMVRLRLDHDRLSLTIRDDGRGFEQPLELSSGRASSGNGLQNLRLRSLRLGATCRIEAKPDQGTEIEFSIPI